MKKKLITILLLVIAILFLWILENEILDILIRLVGILCLTCVFLCVVFYVLKGRAVNIPMQDKPRIEILREYAAYDMKQKKHCSYRFELGKQPPAQLEKYGYAEWIKGLPADSDELCFALFDFVCTNFHHDGSVSFCHGKRMADIIEACEAGGQKTNCRGLSMILAALLRMHHVKARHVTCMPYEQPFGDCHVVVDCLLPSSKRIMFDPTYYAYFTDKEGEYVSVRRLREILISGDALFENKEASYNGEPFDKAHYIDYMSKNTFRFDAGRIYADVKEERVLGRIELVPKDYYTQFLRGWRGIVVNPDMFWDIV